MSGLDHKKLYSPPELGLNSRYSAVVINDKEASVLLNNEVNNDGTLAKYPGYVKDGSPFPNESTAFIRSMWDFKRGSSTDLLLISAADSGNANTTYKVDIKSTIGDGTYQYFGHTIGTAAFTNGNTAVVGTNTHWLVELKAGDKIKVTSQTNAQYTEIASVTNDTNLVLVGGGYLGATSGGAVAYTARKIWNKGNVIRMATFNNVVIMTDGNGIPQQYDTVSVNSLINTYSGTTLTAQANAAPKGSYVISHKQRVFMASTPTDPSGLYWSHVNDQTFWDPASYEPIFPQDGGNIIAIISYADSIVIFKNNGLIYRVFGNFDDSAIGTIAYISKMDYSEHIGIIADRSVFIHNDLLYFMAETGVYTIDQRGVIQKISYFIEPFIKSLNFSLTGNANKSFPFTNKSQWDAGTHSGSYANTDGILRTFFDDFRQTDASQNYNLCAVALGTNNVLHVAYVPNTDATKITYARYQPDGTLLKEDTGLSTNTVGSVSIDVSGVDQTVGIAYTTTERQTRFVERTPDVGAVLGTWGATAIVGGSADGPVMCSFKYSSGGVPNVGICGEAGGFGFLGYNTRTVGVWGSFVQIQSFTGDSFSSARVSLCLDGSSNIYIAFMWGGGANVWTTKSTNGGATWNTIEDWRGVSPSANLESSLTSFLDHSNNFFTAYSNSVGVIKRNHTATSQVTFDSTANSLNRGFLNIITGSTDKFYSLNITGTPTAQVEKYTFETSSSLVNPTANVISKTAGNRPGDRPLVHNGQVIASVGFGTNANEIVIRRLALFGNWTGPESSDATLSAWSTYDVSGEADNGNTVTHQVALASSSPPTSFVNIIPGAVISSSPALNFVIPKVLFTIIAWSGVQITSIILNYIGAAIDGKQIFGISYYNEAFFACSEMGQTANNKVLVQDIKDAYLLVTYAVSVMEKFKTKLYGGSSTNGDLYILKTGWNFGGSIYSSDFQSKEDFLDSIELEKSVHKIYVLYRVQSVGSFTFSYRVDSFVTNGGSTWTDATVDQTDLGIYEVNVLQKVRSIQFRVQNSGLDNQLNILGFVTVFGNLNIR